jgi:L-fuculose-phosphate aldolase
MTDGKLRAQLVDYSRRLHARGWVANHEGNLSVRLGQDRFLCTPTAYSKAEVSADSLVIVDNRGAVITGRNRPFSEMALHLCVYRERPDVHAVVHAHAPHATALSAAGLALDRPFSAEAVVSLGPTVPVVPLSAPGEAAVAALRPFVAAYDVVMVAGNGVFSWGSDIEQAYLRLELCEQLARIYLLALPAGGVKPLPPALLPSLFEARRKAGLGPEARGVAAPPKPVLDNDKIAALIREELSTLIKSP